MKRLFKHWCYPIIGGLAVGLLLLFFEHWWWPEIPSQPIANHKADQSNGKLNPPMMSGGGTSLTPKLPDLVNGQRGRWVRFHDGSEKFVPFKSGPVAQLPDWSIGWN